MFLVALGSIVGGGSTARAHSCAVPVTVAQGEATDVEVGVTVGDVPVSEITFEFDLSIEITRDVERRGWTVEQEESAVRFSGGRLDAGVCELFEVPIRAKNAGSFRVRAFQRLDDGQIVEHPPDGDMFANPGGETVLVNHSGPPNAEFEQVIHVTADGGGSGARTGLLVATLVAGVAAAIYFVPRSGRRR